jgi:very-short-patch-repair endonuclease
MSEAEKRLWYHLRAHRFLGARFRRQALIGPYIVDFVCHDAGLIIELDGGQHGSSIGRRRDRERDTWLASQGYKVLRFWNSDVLRNIDGVLEVIAIDVQQNPPPCSPRSGEQTSPSRGEVTRDAPL